MLNSNTTDRLSRRQAVGAAAGAGLVAAFLGNGTASAGPDGEPPSEPGPMNGLGDITTLSRDVLKAPTTPGVSYVSLAGVSFFLAEHSGNGTKDSSAGEMSSTSATFATAPVFLPNGSVIAELVSYVTRPTVATTTIRLVAHRSSLGVPGFVEVAHQSTSSVAPGSTVQQLVSPIPPARSGALVDTTDAAYFVLVNPPANAGHLLWGVRIGYRAPGAGVYYPIDPIRAFDSRVLAYVASGRFLPNSSRVIAVRDGHDSVGAVTSPDVVPVSATAVTCNLTVTSTVGPNFLALTPGDAAGYTTSAINWSESGASVANGLTSRIDTNRTVKVWCGDQSGTTDAIIDINGYYLPA